jgi:hypothetical protein
MAATTPAQSLYAGWRNCRSDGYHGLSSRRRSQRHSLSWRFSSQTGRPQQRPRRF